MPTVEVSELVKAWLADERERRLGQSDDDILRSLIGLPSRAGAVHRGNSSGLAVVSPARRAQTVTVGQTLAGRRLRSYVDGNQLVVGFVGSAEHRWTLPSRDDKIHIRAVRDQAVQFAAENGATIGQQNAVKKALTENGYHLSVR